ncbi:MAG: efflux RND transporter periplasmic adaptor subunit [Melioribacteraceae bacterium]|nr:efflux RND transporter periplasmic adaptor subunit [Melioribacteraceae bacterium]
MANGNKKKSKKKLFIFGGIGALVVIIVILVLTSSDKERIIQVQTEETSKRTITQIVTATGKIYPEYQVILRPEVTGEVVQLPVEEGQKVQKGQLLIRIKPEQYIAQRNQARAQWEAAKAQLKVREADLDRVKAEYDRVKDLFEKKLASEQEMEIAKASFLQSEGQYEAQIAAVDQAKERLNDSQVQLDKTTIYSPIDGWITSLPVELSERVLGSSFSQGTQLMTVADLNNMEARVEVDENDVVLVSVGDTAYVEVDAFGDKKFLGLVSQIGNSAQTTGLGTQDEVVNFEVRIRIVDPGRELRPGMSCDSDIETETRTDVVAVPIQSVTARMDKPMNGNDENSDEEVEDDRPNRNNSKPNGNPNKPKEVVFVADGNVAKKVEVETGISDDNYIEIIKGLDGTEKVISGPYRAISKELEDGTKIRVPGGDKTKKDSEEQKSDSTSN